MNTVLVVVLMFGALILALIYIPRYLVGKAIRQIVALFRERKATNPANATTMEELGVIRGSPLDRMFKMRDYRPNALRVLQQADIIRVTETGKVYLSEEALKNSRVKDFARVK